MKVLVTGANGIVGTFLCKELSDNGHEVVGMVREHSDLALMRQYCPDVALVKGDVLDLLSLVGAFEGKDLIVHCAAVVSFDSKDKHDLFVVNVEGTQNVINTCLSLGIPRVVHVSSVAALGRDKNKLELDEKAKWIEGELNSAYAKSKYLSELEAWRGDNEGLEVLVVNPSVVLGPASQKQSSGQLFDLAKKGKSLFVDGKFNYIDVRDLVKIVYLLIEKEAYGERYILNNGNISYQHFFGKTAKILGVNAPKVEVKRWQLYMLWPVFSLFSLLFRKKSIVSKEMIQLTKYHFKYKNNKVNAFLDGFEYTSIDETLNWALKN